MGEKVTHFVEVQTRDTMGRGFRMVVASASIALGLLGAASILYDFAGLPPFVGVVLVALALTGVVLLTDWGLVQQRTVVRADGLELAQGPRLSNPKRLHLKVALEELEAVEEASFTPLVDGAWGLREGRGVRISFKDGDEIHVGSERPDALLRALEGARGTT